MNITPTMMPVSTTAPAVSSPPAPPPASAKPGKAVGQIAKQAVEAARQAGIDLPKNAQGLAASQIAKGADPASVFQAKTTPVTDPPADDVPVPDTDTDPVVWAVPEPQVPDVPQEPDIPQSDPAPSSSEAAMLYTEASITVAGVSATSAEVALDLLR